jgi:deazaflavin-dependent oxidoreductase (nitroreductase family)
MAHFNRLATNRLARPLAKRLPGFGVVVHVGRSSGRRYSTPVNVFRSPDGYVIALSYGRNAEWVKNVVAAGRCELITRGRRRTLIPEEVVHDEARTHVPRLVRPPLRVLGVSDFLRLRGGLDD